MLQVTEPDFELKVHFQHYPKSPLPYLAWIEGEQYKGIVVQASSIDECMKELSVSLKVLELYRNNIKKDSL